MGRPRERRPLFGGVYVLVPIWLGAPRPAWPPKSLMKRGLPGFLGRYLVTVTTCTEGKAVLERAGTLLVTRERHASPHAYGFTIS